MEYDRRVQMINRMLEENYTPKKDISSYGVEDMILASKLGCPAGSRHYFEDLLMQSLGYFSGQRAKSIYLLSPLTDFRNVQIEID